MIRSLILVVLLAVGLSSCTPVPHVGPAEAARAWGSWEKGMEAIHRYRAQGMTTQEAIKEAAKGPKGGDK